MNVTYRMEKQLLLPDVGMRHFHLGALDGLSIARNYPPCHTLFLLSLQIIKALRVLDEFL